MHFVPWKTIDLDGAFRITAPDSISEEVIQEVSNGITFKFNGKLEKTKLEILLTAPFEWEETLHPTERGNPPVKFICRLISRSTGRREIIELEDGGGGFFFSETSYIPFLNGEEVRAEALLVRTEQFAGEKARSGYATEMGQIIGRSLIHTIRFATAEANNDSIFNIKWQSFPTESKDQLWRLIPSEPPVIEMNADVTTSLKKLLMSKSLRKDINSLQRDIIFTAICSTVWTMLISISMNSIQNLLNTNSDLSSEEIIEQLPPSQLQTLSLFSKNLLETNISPHEAVVALANELRSPESFQKFILKMSSIIQQETKILELAEIMARGCSFESEIPVDLEKEEVA
ncbi:hypothetical protein PMT9312_0380 [Prochlorococcus marinus str. MIT 9312]|uniref:Uncharacterized protein n=1 Tax=Prochlorococcus marinus (strain MIT 9312) TaxID=74546 RepID=Q31CF4_PROM9|nr:hypothetical protein [Prochlorococcus marinus]ABB49441.1 hypothetical protein PMT9312_0380 [Prochlorococcus marinus str. MIT 9312]KGG00780.1 hypothetical protein EU97_0749 [Prochlorococcus marinus str. MIT 9311]